MAIHIKKFNHDVNNLLITATVSVGGEDVLLRIEEEDGTVTSTDFEEESTNWSDREYDALEEFVQGCISIIFSQVRY